MNGMEVLEKVINDLIKLIEAGFSFNIAGRPVFIAPSTIMIIVINSWRKPIGLPMG